MILLTQYNQDLKQNCADNVDIRRMIKTLYDTIFVVEKKIIQYPIITSLCNTYETFVVKMGSTSVALTNRKSVFIFYLFPMSVKTMPIIRFFTI